MQQLNSQPDPQSEPYNDIDAKFKKFCEAFANLKANQPAIEYHETMKCQHCKNPYDQRQHKIGQLSCNHQIGESCLTNRENCQCPFECNGAKRMEVSQALLHLAEKELKKQQQLRCITHPKYKVKLYSETNNCFYCYKCLAKEKLLYQNIMPINDILEQMKKLVIDTSKEYQAKFRQLKKQNEDKEILEIQQHLLEMKQQAVEIEAKLIALIKESKEIHCGALDEAAMQATAGFNASCIAHIGYYQYQARDLKSKVASISGNFENTIESLTQLMLEGKEIEEEYKCLSVQQPDWGSVVFNIDDWKDKFKKYDKLNIDGTLFEQLAVLNRNL